MSKPKNNGNTNIPQYTKTELLNSKIGLFKQIVRIVVDWVLPKGEPEDVHGDVRQHVDGPQQCNSKNKHFSPKFEAEKRRSNKDDTATRIKCAIAAKRKALNGCILRYISLKKQFLAILECSDMVFLITRQSSSAVCFPFVNPHIGHTFNSFETWMWKRYCTPDDRPGAARCNMVCVCVLGEGGVWRGRLPRRIADRVSIKGGGAPGLAARAQTATDGHGGPVCRVPSPSWVCVDQVLGNAVVHSQGGGGGREVAASRGPGRANNLSYQPVPPCALQLRVYVTSFNIPQPPPPTTLSPVADNTERYRLSSCTVRPRLHLGSSVAATAPARSSNAHRGKTRSCYTSLQLILFVLPQGERPGHRILASGNSAGLCRSRRVFSGIPRFSRPSFQRRSIFTSTHLIGSQYLAVKSRPNLFTLIRTRANIQLSRIVEFRWRKLNYREISIETGIGLELRSPDIGSDKLLVQPAIEPDYLRVFFRVEREFEFSQRAPIPRR
ncbi:hypothetical protein PR048_005564 [Dryococelus australis]|uniref:Uncharacterized protein n=1 Tax=Dryococelus australis TaxID=614101 RepID=A0ABQ9I8L8_9NEOP|nr:hypothetical protein PR048_005564 [Dryococelus australis]